MIKVLRCESTVCSRSSALDVCVFIVHFPSRSLFEGEASDDDDESLYEIASGEEDEESQLESDEVSDENDLEQTVDEIDTSSLEKSLQDAAHEPELRTEADEKPSDVDNTCKRGSSTADLETDNRVGRTGEMPSQLRDGENNLLSIPNQLPRTYVPRR